MAGADIVRIGMIAVALASGATPALARKKDADPAVLSSDVLRDRGAAMLIARQGDRALPMLSELVARQPRDGAAQTLLALAWHQAGASRGDAIDLALAGYDLAARADPGGSWPAALSGRATFDQGRYAEASEHFARAVALRPDDARLLGSLGAAAYMAGDAMLAGIASARAVAVDGGRNPDLLRLAALAAAAGGDGGTARRYATRLEVVAPVLAAATHARIAQIEQTAAIDRPVPLDAPPQGPGSTDQVSVDVAIVLSQNTRRERSGINLLDGLSLQYGLGRNSTRTVRDDGGSGGANDYQRVLTSAITVPQLNYNLNLFSRGGQYYSVVARPQLTAYRGEPSEFFVGRSLKVAVNGIQSGSLEQIDIGVELKVTPVEITATGTRVKIEASRSFVTADPAGSFAEALTTFRQKVAATAEIRFGETLLLSGLNETVDDMTFSKTPVLGDLPVVGNLFHERGKTQRRDAVIVLVTPSRPTGLAGRPFARGEHAARLTRLWTQVVDPMSDAAATAMRLSQMRMFSRMTRGDVTLAFPDAATAAGEMLEEILLPRSR
ncbi:tetratricopeptide repeat protein [Sphingomonas silueang]|uniref:tetratricopeptide repeat protein n=1 Tax=Sphingomonas silueang TaxID=3156617 RepID=UPI0032B5FE4D